MVEMAICVSEVGGLVSTVRVGDWALLRWAPCGFVSLKGRMKHVVTGGYVLGSYEEFWMT